MSNAEVKYERLVAPCKFFDRTKGFGFIKRPNKPDIFFTAKTLDRAKIKTVEENELLEFDLIPIPGKGGKAINIVKVEK